jgi:hypothetical protein
MAFFNRNRLIAFLLLSSIYLALARKKKPEEEDLQEALGIPQVHPLVEMIGKEMYSAVNTPKYKFYIYMTIGTLPNEKNTIALLSTLCNVLYGTFVWLGFLFLPRDRMLLFTLITFYVGPAMILIVLGLIGGAFVAFALYPVYSVVALWLWFFLTSQIAQALGTYLGLDSDKDGDVDMLDLLHWAGKTKIGKSLGLMGLYRVLNSYANDPFREIFRRLDEITERIKAKEIDGEEPDAVKEEMVTPPLKQRLRSKTPAKGD